MPEDARTGSQESLHQDPSNPGGVDGILASFDGSTADLFKQMREHAEHLQQWEVKLRAQSARAANADRPNGSPPWLDDRRARLARVRHIVRERLRNLRRKERLLEERERACEQIVEQRRSIASKEAKVNQREQRVIRAAARTRASVTVLGAAIVFGLSIGGAWVLSGVVKPRDVVVSGVLASIAGEDPRGAWSNKVAVHLNSPQVAASTSRELVKRGVVGYENAADVTELIRTRLALVNRQGGSMLIEIRGNGATPTKRTLESLLAETVQAINSDDARDIMRSKVDGPVIVDPVEVTAERIALSSALAAGLFMLAGLFWIVVRIQAARSHQVIARLAGPDDEFAQHAA